MLLSATMRVGADTRLTARQEEPRRFGSWVRSRLRKAAARIDFLSDFDTEGEVPPFGADLAERVLVPYPIESALSGIMRHEDHMSWCCCRTAWPLGSRERLGCWPARRAVPGTLERPRHPGAGLPILLAET